MTMNSSGSGYVRRPTVTCRSPVDLVGEKDVVKDGAFLKLKAAVLGPVDLGPGQIRRQQIRGELHAVKIAVDALGQLLDSSGLGETRRPLDEHMTITEQGDDEPVDERFLSDNAGAELGPQRAEARQWIGGLRTNACTGIHVLLQILDIPATPGR
jgi:hypothetical protein